MWEGECFVFDNSVSVNHQLEKDIYDQCHACRMPITEEDKAHEHFMHGVSCHHCYDQTSEVQKQRYIERQKQMKLAEARGEDHIGGDVVKFANKHRDEKKKFKEAQNKKHR